MEQKRTCRSDKTTEAARKRSKWTTPILGLGPWRISTT